jgi:hypothetical protein
MFISSRCALAAVCVVVAHGAALNQMSTQGAQFLGHKSFLGRIGLVEDVDQQSNIMTQVVYRLRSHFQRQQPKKVFERAMMGMVGLIFGSIFACAGSALICGAIKGQLKSRSMLGGGTQEAQATVTGKSHHEYEVSYNFEAVRDDGMRCKVTVAGKSQPKSVWDRLEDGCKVPVTYFTDSPGHCRLTESAHQDVQPWASIMSDCLFGIVFVAVGFYAAVIYPAYELKHGFVAFLLYSAIWISCVAIAFAAIVSKLAEPSGQVEELGMQNLSQKIGDIEDGTSVLPRVHPPSGWRCCSRRPATAT